MLVKPWTIKTIKIRVCAIMQSIGGLTCLKRDMVKTPQKIAHKKSNVTMNMFNILFITLSFYYDSNKYLTYSVIFSITVSMFLALKIATLFKQ